MSLYGVLRTGVSGMNAQGTKLSTVADNIANQNTAGYKRASTEFSTLVVNSGQRSSYTPGGVTTQIRYAISEEGQTYYTNSATDLRLNGQGFFVVQDAGGTPYLTRAGSFVPNETGELINAGGFKLLGYNLANGTPTPVANSLAGLEVVNIYAQGMVATPSTTGFMTATLNSNAAVVDPLVDDTAGENTAASQYTNKSSLSAYDNLGNEVILDIYYTKTAANTWEVAVYNKADATAGGFPYGAAGSPALYEGSMAFNGITGQFAGMTPAGAVGFTIPNGQPFTLDLSKMTQLGTTEFAPEGDTNGNAPSAVDRVEISEEGIVYAIFENGDRLATYQLAVADVPSPDNLTPLTGNVFGLSMNSGDVTVGFAGQGGMGTVGSGALEMSNVDLGAELTAMIEAQRGYQANSKTFQTGSELLEVLVNLKR
jgi:flagellar hook protein FlgE